VDGWDDPRMPTLAGVRRRGYPPEALRNFCTRQGIAKKDGSLASMAQLEHAVREVLNARARRVMAVLDPLKVVIESYPEGQLEQLEAVNNPENEADGTRLVPFSREIWIERSDFLEEPPRKFFRLAPGIEVRLKHAYFITCTDVVKDADGRIVELRCTHDPATRGGSAPDGRSPKGTLHWVSAAQAVEAEVRLYDVLFSVETPGRTKADVDFLETINPQSLEVVPGCWVEPCAAEARPGDFLQFLRHGYFVRDSRSDGLVFNRTVGLRDTWAKVQAQRG
jgi:glutaminyl-tRNA synthetase